MPMRTVPGLEKINTLGLLAQLVEHPLGMREVRGSSPLSSTRCFVAQLAERTPCAGVDEGSNPSETASTLPADHTGQVCHLICEVRG